MTGASLYYQLNDNWNYIKHKHTPKDERHSKPTDYIGYTHILTANPHKHNESFEIIDVIYGYDRMQLENPIQVIRNWFDFLKSLGNFNVSLKDVRDSLMPVKMIMKPKVWIMKRRSEQLVDNN